MLLILSLVIVVYCLGLLFLKIQWSEIPDLEPVISDDAITVIIPVRNEESTIESTVKSVLDNKYPNFEILVINDHSDDRTEEILSSMVESSSRLQVLSLPDSKSGKKAAIAFGVDHAKSEWVICTDGDTLVGQNWIQEHANALSTGSALTFGPVVYQNAQRNSFTRLLNIELAVLVGVGAATMQAGFPTMINGCNYGFEKSAFRMVGGFDDNDSIPTGDDEFLLRKIHAHGGKVHFLKSKEALVRTEAVNNVGELLRQRTRWASKWRFHTGWISRLLPMFVFFMYLLILSSIFILNVDLQWLFILGFFKTAFEYSFIQNVNLDRQEKVGWVDVLGMQIIYPFYVVFFGIASNFGSYTWKNRRFKT